MIQIFHFSLHLLKIDHSRQLWLFILFLVAFLPLWHCSVNEKLIFDNFNVLCSSFWVICLCFPILLFKVRPETVCFKLSPPRLQNFVMINSIQPNQQFWRGTNIFTQLSWISFHLDISFSLNYLGSLLISITMFTLSTILNLFSWG